MFNVLADHPEEGPHRLNERGVAVCDVLSSARHYNSSGDEQERPHQAVPGIIHAK